MKFDPYRPAKIYWLRTRPRFVIRPEPFFSIMGTIQGMIPVMTVMFWF
jgi:hypothetical protein